MWCAQKKKKSDRKIKKSKKKDLTGPALLEMSPEQNQQQQSRSRLAQNRIVRFWQGVADEGVG